MFRILFSLLVVVFLAGPSSAQEARTLQKLSDHVYAYVGVTNASPSANSFGANSGVVIGEDAVLVVDTLMSAKEADKLLADIKKVTDKPIKYAVNTHYHPDHAWGNEVFVNEGAAVIGHENSRLAAPRSEYELLHAKEFGLTDQDMEGTVLKFPTVTFKDALRVDLGGGVAVELSYPGATHTDGSITAFVPGDKVLFMGDMLFTKYHPYIGEGDIPSWLKVLSGLEKTPALVIVPGHGPVSTVSDIKAMEVYLKEFDARAKDLCRGKKQEDAPLIAAELLKQLPNQGRTELAVMVESNLREKYLPPAAPVSGVIK
jgi:glyoxylase-like metal-dependent hydrolase (beta-lactamase superfamily II)